MLRKRCLYVHVFMDINYYYSYFQHQHTIPHSRSAPAIHRDRGSSSIRERGYSGDAGDSEDEPDVIPTLSTEAESPALEVTLVKSALPKPTAEIIQMLLIRLNDIVANIADYPPALHFVRLVLLRLVSQPTYNYYFLRFFKDDTLELSGRNIYNFPREMQRQGVCILLSCFIVMIDCLFYIQYLLTRSWAV